MFDRRLATLVLPVLLACGGPAPDDVTRDFWTAVETGDAAAARAVTTPETGRVVEALAAELRIQKVLVGETLTGEERALVSTSLFTLAEEDVELEATFHTHLLRHGEGWRVDAVRSRSELRKAVFVAGMRDVGEALGEGAREIGEALREGAREMEESIRQALEGFEDGTRM